jgi:hypothetical protein
MRAAAVRSASTHSTLGSLPPGDPPIHLLAELSVVDTDLEPRLARGVVAVLATLERGLDSQDLTVS